MQFVAELEAMRELVVARTNDRWVLGSMNDFAWMMRADVDVRVAIRGGEVDARAPASDHIHLDAGFKDVHRSRVAIAPSSA